MKKSSFNYSDLSKKQLEKLKEFYANKKVESMSPKELKKYVLEIISHQINDTIDKEEEMEAWREMSDFFGEQFEIIILEIQSRYIDHQKVLETEIDPQEKRIELLERNNLDQEKTDMWNDQNQGQDVFYIKNLSCFVESKNAVKKLFYLCRELDKCSIYCSKKHCFDINNIIYTIHLNN